MRRAGMAVALSLLVLSPAVTKAASDLVVSGVAGPAAAGSGDSVLVTTVVTNVGAGEAGGCQLGIYLSVDAEITADDVLVGTRDIPPLASGESSSDTAVVALPPWMAGSFYLGAIADRNGAVADNDRSNDALVGSAIAIAAPDLTVSAVTVTGVSGPAAAGSGDWIDVTTGQVPAHRLGRRLRFSRAELDGLLGRGR